MYIWLSTFHLDLLKTNFILLSSAASLQISLPSCTPRLRCWHCHLIRHSSRQPGGHLDLQLPLIRASFWFWVLSILRPRSLSSQRLPIISRQLWLRAGPPLPSGFPQWPPCIWALPSSLLSKWSVIFITGTSYNVIHLRTTLWHTEPPHLGFLPWVRPVVYVLLCLIKWFSDSLSTIKSNLNKDLKAFQENGLCQTLNLQYLMIHSVNSERFPE